MSDSPLTDWALQQVKAHRWEVYLGIGIASAGVGFVVGWFAALLKTKAEITKIREDARKASGDNLEKLAQLRAAVISKGQVLDMCQQNMRDALLENQRGTDNLEKLRGCRDEMCNVYQNEYLPTATTYVEMIPRLVDRKEALIRARTELIPRLQSICVFLEMVNLEEMLKKVQVSKPYKIKRAGRDGLLLRVETLVPWRCRKLRRELGAIRKRTDKHLRD